MVDPHHMKAYRKETINYNRDVEVFPVVKSILKKIMRSKAIYNSPTDMGVNRAGFGITNDSVVREAAKQEIIRRYFRYSCEYMMGLAGKDTVKHAEDIMKRMKLDQYKRRVVKPARHAAVDAERKKKGNEGIFCGAALELKDGSIVTGKNSPLMHAASSLVLNSIKKMAGIPDHLHLLSPATIQTITNLKKNILSSKSVSLDLEETLIALSISAEINTVGRLAMNKLKELQSCEAHMTYMPLPGDEAGLRKLGINLTTDPKFSTQSLFVA